ncbi:nucleoside 2-deoxyribosyltransferase (plasmid) [Paraburkholderia sp. D15]|uniref:nucleoside 2-deoxyribosyltransferase n=1 Tax=Paraburkholderia sp. D15 TaxID=2880218 RepID=UPI0024788D82|nr:nucleoside 2-deoxyribosyltransferase [Paraburkholderia sp. D15]WGS55042.1 nucleoside 2-deoxyribosyltransferase [Paraburkholderia sp. D15]
MTDGTRAAGRRRIYLAGFDVFRIDAVDYGRSLQRLCARFGFEGVFPLDASAPPGLEQADLAAWICRANLAAIRAADMVMANVADFRGVGEPDCGTAFEMGFAAALGKEIWGYRDHDRPLLRHVPSTITPAGRVCEKGYLVEDFGLPVNLMLACSARIIAGGPQACLSAIAQAWGSDSTPSPYRPTGESQIRVA